MEAMTKGESFGRTRRKLSLSAASIDGRSAASVLDVLEAIDETQEADYPPNPVMSPLTRSLRSLAVLVAPQEGDNLEAIRVGTSNAMVTTMEGAVISKKLEVECHSQISESISTLLTQLLISSVCEFCNLKLKQMQRLLQTLRDVQTKELPRRRVRLPTSRKVLLIRNAPSLIYLFLSSKPEPRWMLERNWP
jgi:hypothetical protein